jgi:hypothetical protein
VKTWNIAKKQFTCSNPDIYCTFKYWRANHFVFSNRSLVSFREIAVSYFMKHPQADLAGCLSQRYEGISKSFRNESVTKYTLTTVSTRWEATQVIWRQNSL